MTLIKNQTFDEERALYGSDGVTVMSCRFEGPADGESALKESNELRSDRALPRGERSSQTCKWRIRCLKRGLRGSAKLKNVLNQKK